MVLSCSLVQTRAQDTCAQGQQETKSPVGMWPGIPPTRISHQAARRPGMSLLTRLRLLGSGCPC